MHESHNQSLPYTEGCSSPVLSELVTGRAGAQGQGPFMYIRASFDGTAFRSADYETYGCPTAMRCGDWITKWMVGRTPEAVQVIDPPDLILVLGGLPLGKEHCAQLAVTALHDIIRQLKKEKTVP